MSKATLPFKTVARHANLQCRRLLAKWLPGGHVEKYDYVALNWKRGDRRKGSLRIHEQGYWIEYATGDKGGDLISLYAYLYNTTQYQALQDVAQELGLI